MSKQRESIGITQGGTAFKDSLKMCNAQLEYAADRIKSNAESFDENTVNNWRERIISLAKDIAVVKNTNEKTVEVLESILGEKRQLDEEQESSSSSTNAAETKLKQQIKQRIAEKIQKFEESKDPNAKKICDMLKTSSNADEFELIEEGFKLTDTICPYTKKTYVETMKRLPSLLAS